MGSSHWHHLEPIEKAALDICSYPGLVVETLELILNLFKDSQKLRDKYGCTDVKKSDVMDLAKPSSKRSVLNHFNASLDNYKTKIDAREGRTSLVGKTYWVVRDRKKFELLIHKAKALIDGLQGITKDLRSQASQHEMMRSRISSIDDVRILDWVSEVCEVDYLVVSDAASSKADTISDDSTFHHNIQDWRDAIALEDEGSESDTSSEETTIAGLEDMTVTELKHRFSSYLLRAKGTRLEKKDSQRKENIPESQKVDTPTTFPVLPWEREVIKLDTKRWGRIVDNDSKKDPPIIEAELRISENIMSSMAEAAADKDFSDEITAVLQWFAVLGPAERTTVFYKLGDKLSDDLDTTRFFAMIQNHRLSKHLS